MPSPRRQIDLNDARTSSALIAPPAPPVRPRRRIQADALQPVAEMPALPEVAPQPTQGVATLVQAQTMRAGEELVADFWRKNHAANAAKREADAAKKALETHMAQNGTTLLTNTVTFPGKSEIVDAVIADAQENVIDIALLRSKVSADDFLRIVTASASAVTNVAGKNTAAACTVVKIKPAFLSVKVRK